MLCWLYIFITFLQKNMLQWIKHPNIIYDMAEGLFCSKDIIPMGTERTIQSPVPLSNGRIYVSS